MQPGKCTAVTGCELSITGTLMTSLLTVDRQCKEFLCVCVWRGGCRLMVCRSLLPSSQRQHTVWIEIVCSCGSACQLLHRICIIQQPRGRGEWGARGEGTRHGEELAYRKREHSLGLNKLTETDWLRGRVADVNVRYFFFFFHRRSLVVESIFDFHFVVAAAALSDPV